MCKGEKVHYFKYNKYYNAIIKIVSGMDEISVFIEKGIPNRH